MKLPEVELSMVLKNQNPFTLAFVYAKNGKNFLVKGSSGEVSNYIRDNFPFAFVHYTYWKDGQHRSHWSPSPGLGLYISHRRVDQPAFTAAYSFSDVIPSGRKRFYISMMTKDGMKTDVASFRTMPRRWIPLFDEAIHSKVTGKTVPVAVY